MMYKTVIGLEVHCEIKTKSKCFSTAKNTFSNKPNENVVPIDLGLPGILPVPNKEAVKCAIKTALAINCTIPDELIFDRKNYFYPDLPKGYQITQVTKPVGKNGYLIIEVDGVEKKIDIHQLHLEEDTASLEHFSNYSLIDYNRSGIPLMEIVTEPCISNADEAIAFLETLRSIFIYCDVSEADSKKGQMRCDVNISLMKDTDTKLGTKVEMKNINSFSNVRASIEYEIKRQSKILDDGGKVIQETRRYDTEDSKTYTMREKVDAVDYKYFIEPNIPPVKLEDTFIESVKSEIPELPKERKDKYINKYELSKYDSVILSKDRNVSDYFEELLSYGVKPKDAANWVITSILGSVNKLEIDIKDFFITPKMLADLITLIDEGKISLRQGQKTLYKAIEEQKEPIKLIEELNIEQIDDRDKLIILINESLDEFPSVVKQYKEGKDYAANYFVGSVMKKTKGQASPKITLELVKEELEKR